MKHNPNTYDATTTLEQLKVMRHLLVSARRILWDIDEAKSDDPVFANPWHVKGPGAEDAVMHPDVMALQSHLDLAITATAKMQDKLDED